MTALKSAIYMGRLSHVRRAPKRHAFSYPLYMMYLDLDELEQLSTGWIFGVEKSRALSFRRSDYFGSESTPLKDAIWSEVGREFGHLERGPVRMLTHVRSFGYVFNPVTFYYCFSPDGRLSAVVSEITNTPWGERHRYVLRADEDGSHERFAKRFHVSPFFPMNHRYDWSFSNPGERLNVTMHNEGDQGRVFTARLELERHPWRAAGLLSVAARQPLMSLKVHAWIYLHAARLWLKGTPFFDHPKSIGDQQ